MWWCLFDLLQNGFFVIFNQHSLLFEPVDDQSSDMAILFQKWIRLKNQTCLFQEAEIRTFGKTQVH
jgi:hypothetical protein